MSMSMEEGKYERTDWTLATDGRSPKPGMGRQREHHSQSALPSDECCYIGLSQQRWMSRFGGPSCCTQGLSKALKNLETVTLGCLKI